MNVRRVETSTGRHIEPRCPVERTEIERLKWRAAVLALDTGLALSITPSVYSINGIPQTGFFDVGGDDWGQGPMLFRNAWSFLNGISVGYRLLSRMESL